MTSMETLLFFARSRRAVRLDVGGTTIDGCIAIVGREVLVLQRGSLRGVRVLASAIERVAEVER